MPHKGAESPPPVISLEAIMPEVDPEYMTNVKVTVIGTDNVNEICGMLRGLLHSNGNSGGQSARNQDFRRGVVISFGTGPMATKFIDCAEALFSKSALKRMTLKREG
jgi:hypothetical protein